MSGYQENKLKENVLLYVGNYLKGLNETIEKYYKAKTEELARLGFLSPYLFLYKKEWGRDFSVAVFNSDADFFVFFIKPTGRKITKLIEKTDSSGYGRDWTLKTPYHVRLTKVLGLLRLKDNQLVDEPVNVSSQGFIMSPEGALMSNGESLGIRKAEKYGMLLEKIYPHLKAQDEHTKKLLSFRKRYNKLKKSSEEKKKIKGLAQKIGHEFERLFRELVEYYGWQPKKIRIAGEEDDFTAIYEGNHILAEVRWYKKPLGAAKVREFSAKLNPRPQTLGLIISYSGFNDGAYSEARKQVNAGKAIVFFHKEQIELIIEKLVDPGEVFSRELRDVYDYLFEKIKK